VRSHAASNPATRKAIPIVIGTNRKGYTVVMPNCQRDRSSTFTGCLQQSLWAGKKVPSWRAA